jgi:hypothetical protein
LGWRPHRRRARRADIRSAASSFLKNINFLMTRSHVLPDGPPPEVQDEIDAAWERAQAPADGLFELHFASHPRRRRAWAELTWPDGTPAHRLTASEALAVACGDPVALPV